jgi:hypothetical protein
MIASMPSKIRNIDVGVVLSLLSACSRVGMAIFQAIGVVCVAEPSILQTEHIELSFAPHSWSFAQQRSVEINEYFVSLQRKKPNLWNGQILMLREAVISDGVFRGTCFPVDYASYLAWRDWGFPDDSVKLCVAYGGTAIH